MTQAEIVMRWQGYRHCPQCMMFHEFPEAMKSAGLIAPDHAWTVPTHLPPELIKDAASFGVYEHGGFLFVGGKKEFAEFWRFHG